MTLINVEKAKVSWVYRARPRGYTTSAGGIDVGHTHTKCIHYWQIKKMIITGLYIKVVYNQSHLESDKDEVNVSNVFVI